MTVKTSNTASSATDHTSHDHGMHDHGAMQVGKRNGSKVDLRVEGMTCAGCAASVQRALETIPGVESAAISVNDGRAAVTGHDLNADVLVRAIRNSGYDAQPIDDMPAPAELRSEIELRQATHEKQWKFRAIVGLSIWAPLEALHWIGKAAGWHAHHGLGWMDWLMLIGASVVMIAAGGGFYKSAWSAARRKSTNMDTLIAMGATTAYVYSLVIFLMRLFGSSIDQPMYFAEAAALLGIISLGHYFEARASARAGSAVRELLELQPDEAEIVVDAASDDRREEDGGGPGQHAAHHPRLPHSPDRTRSSGAASTRVISSAEVKPGNHILIRPGARVPVDGVVVEGESEIDESVVTGESLPVMKKRGDAVVAGSLNTVGRLVIEAKVDGRHTTVSRIAEMVQQAQTSRANIQRLADYIASIFVPAVLGIALLTMIGWSVAGDFTTGVISTVTVLIISCPCALGLATPMAVMVGAGAASKRGVLVKSAMAFETAGKATHVVFDKTGTLTSGRPVVTGLSPVENGTSAESELLRLAAAVESPSEHPVAGAIVKAANERGIQIPSVDNFNAIPGEGVRGVVERRTIVVRRDEHATARVEVDGKSIGTIMVTDELRPGAKHAVEQLQAMGLRVTMLSGDRKSVAEAVGQSLGLKPADVIAEATPERKVEFVANLTTKSDRTTHSPAPSLKGRGGVIMVGDGINDAAALAHADVGIALASGTNIAIESADVVIPGDRVAAVAETIHIARCTLRTIKQNLFFAFFYNAVAIPVAALGLLGPIGPLMAAAAMGLSDITVIGNAIRLKRRLSR